MKHQRFRMSDRVQDVPGFSIVLAGLLMVISGLCMLVIGVVRQ